MSVVSYTRTHIRCFLAHSRSFFFGVRNSFAVSFLMRECIRFFYSVCNIFSAALYSTWIYFGELFTGSHVHCGSVVVSATHGNFDFYLENYILCFHFTLFRIYCVYHRVTHTHSHPIFLLFKLSHIMTMLLCMHEERENFAWCCLCDGILHSFYVHCLSYTVCPNAYGTHRLYWPY